MMPLIEVKNVTRRYSKGSQSLLGLSDVNFTVSKGEIVTLIGPSGCGKTTMLKMLGGLLEPTSGCIKYADSTVEEVRIRGLIGYVSQFPALFPHKTVIENIRFPLEVRKIKNHDYAEMMLRFLGLDGFRDYYPHQLSGGMKQKVSIARATAYNPEILLMDEPFSSLDEIMREKLDTELLRIKSAFGKTIVFVTHNVEEAVYISDKIVVFTEAPGKTATVIEGMFPGETRVGMKKDSRFFERVQEIRKELMPI